MFRWMLRLGGALLLFPWLVVGSCALMHEEPGLFGLGAILSLALTVGSLGGLLPVRLCYAFFGWIRGGQPPSHPYVAGGLAGLTTGLLGAGGLLLWFKFLQSGRGGGEGAFILPLMAPFVLAGCLVTGLLVGRWDQHRQRPSCWPHRPTVPPAPRSRPDRPR